MRNKKYWFLDDADIEVSVSTWPQNCPDSNPFPDGVVWVGLDCSPTTSDLFPIILWHETERGLNDQIAKIPDLLGDSEGSFCKIKAPTFSDEMNRETADLNYNILLVDPSNNERISGPSNQGGIEATDLLADDIEQKNLISTRTTRKESHFRVRFSLNFLEEAANTAIPFFTGTPSSKKFKNTIDRVTVPVYILTNSEESGAPSKDIQTLCSMPNLESDI